jgi:hypothetical protein
MKRIKFKLVEYKLNTKEEITLRKENNKQLRQWFSIGGQFLHSRDI